MQCSELALACAHQPSCNCLASLGSSRDPMIASIQRMPHQWPGQSVLCRPLQQSSQRWMQMLSQAWDRRLPGQPQQQLRSSHPCRCCSHPARSACTRKQAGSKQPHSARSGPAVISADSKLDLSGLPQPSSLLNAGQWKTHGGFRPASCAAADSTAGRTGELCRMR